MDFCSHQRSARKSFNRREKNNSAHKLVDAWVSSLFLFFFFFLLLWFIKRNDLVTRGEQKYQIRSSLNFCFFNVHPVAFNNSDDHCRNDCRDERLKTINDLIAMYASNLLRNLGATFVEKQPQLTSKPEFVGVFSSAFLTCLLVDFWG